MRNKIFQGILSLAIASIFHSAIFSVPCVQARTPRPLRYVVKKVIDGDTLLLEGEKRIRLIGIDTPELHESSKLERDAKRRHHSRKQIRRQGAQARAVVEKLVGKSFVRLERGEESVDRYGRTLAYLFFWSRDEELCKAVALHCASREPAAQHEYMLNRVLVESGYANAMTSYDFKYSQEFTALEAQARREGRGLWKKGSRR